MRKYLGLCLLLLLFVLVTVFVNPLRETPIDDDWAYGLTVRHLLNTGEYRLHDWSAANMPVQVYWAAFLARTFGYSFSILRCSTLILLLVGLIAFYQLLRDFGVGDIEASLLTFALLCSPALFFLSFTFQTDVQFLGWQILALWLYSRAIREQRYSYMALASLAAFAAVGTRQFGAALVGGLVLTWFIFEQRCLRKVPLYLVGLTLPLLMTSWQFSFGVNRPTFSQKVRLAEQVAYMRDLPHLLGDFFWRPTVILQYTGLFLLSLVPVLALIVRSRWKTAVPASLPGSARVSHSSLWLLCFWVMYLIVAICFGYFFYLPHVLMPYLAWLLPNAQTSPFGFKKHLALTLLTFGFAIVFGWLVSSRYLTKRNWQLLSCAEWFVVLSGLALCAIQLLYAQFYDVYLIQFLPFAVFGLARMAPVWPNCYKTVTAVLCLVILSISSLWTRGKLAKAEASWQAAEQACSAGAGPREVGGNMTWSCYHGAFDEWITEIGGLNASDRYIGSHRMHFAFFDFLRRRFDRSQYLIIPSPPDAADPNLQPLRRVEYRDNCLRPQSIYLMIRTTGEAY
jgi:Dolichyl-phosphate-mannose-protein mannosyltransferase